MSKFIVHGGQKLRGEVRVQGSKNAAFPVLAATCLAAGISEIGNVPEIADVDNFTAIMQYLGATVERHGKTIRVDATNLENKSLPAELMSKLRGSVVIIGALLGRFGSAKFSFPGGDAIGKRPIDQHLDGFRQLGAQVAESAELVEITSSGLRGARIVLGFTTVTGTENLILAAVTAQGVTEIRLAACEPHVQSLCNFLNSMGARIDGIGTPNLAITGVRSLRPGNFFLNFDEIAAITYGVAAAVTRGEVRLSGVVSRDLDAPLAVFARMGVNLQVGKDFLQFAPPPGNYKATKIVTGVFPQFLTDYQPLFGVLATQASGETSIHDWIYEGRQGYLRALRTMGARVEFDDLHRSRIIGPTPLFGAEIKTPDIRAGASILIAAFIAKGESIIYNAEIIDRGYEKLDENLRNLGARIERAE